MITQDDIDAMEDGMDGWQKDRVIKSHLDRIEQLERELAEYKDVLSWHEAELTAEKALADRLADKGENLMIGVGMCWDVSGMQEEMYETLAAYRKARGL